MTLLSATPEVREGPEGQSSRPRRRDRGVTKNSAPEHQFEREAEAGGRKIPDDTMRSSESLKEEILTVARSGWKDLRQVCLWVCRKKKKRVRISMIGVGEDVLKLS